MDRVAVLAMEAGDFRMVEAVSPMRRSLVAMGAEEDLTVAVVAMAAEAATAVADITNAAYRLPPKVRICHRSA
jgi:hypothetical protein